MAVEKIQIAIDGEKNFVIDNKYSLSFNSISTKIY
jgi:hypothetical protein